MSMQSGPNQHYLPRFLQRPFGIPPRRKEIWVFARGSDPEARRIKDVGAAYYFYADPAPEGQRTLDHDITDQETPISRLVAGIRATAIGTQVDSRDAATIVNHLVPRTAHVRVSIERGLGLMARGVQTILDEDGRVQALVGLDADEPNAVFRRALADKLGEIEGLSDVGLPREVIERVAFVLAKENFAAVAADFLPVLKRVFASWVERADEVVRDSHNSALAGLSKSSPRHKALEGLTWIVQPGPPEGAILPDCVALAVDRFGQAAPAALADWNGLAVVILPVSPGKLLVGSSRDCDVTQLSNFNVEAARSSDAFFLAAGTSDYLRSLQGLLGERSTQVIEDSLAEAMNPYLALTPKPHSTDEPMYPADLVRPSNEPWQYELSFIECGGADEVQRLTEVLSRVVSSLAPALPLHRLDGITVAADYRKAVADLDRGYESAKAIETAPEALGQGVARTLAVRRQGRWKDRVILDAGVAFALLAEDEGAVELALHMLVDQFASIALTEMVERRLPGVWMQPIRDDLQSFVYPHIHPAIFGYLGSHISAGFGDPPHLRGVKRELFNNALVELRSTGLASRLAYRHHGDLDRLLDEVMPRIAYALQFGAELLGHCAASGEDPFDGEGKLASALDTAGLRHWFPIFADQLERLRLRMGRWESFDEFLALGVHVERLLWQLGLLPWVTPQGLRFEVPLGTDIEQLLANAGQGNV